MHLLDSELKNKEQWEKAEISLPQFDRQAMKEETKKNPQWVHFGAGNIFRAGALNYTPVAKVTNLSATMKELKKQVSS